MLCIRWQQKQICTHSKLRATQWQIQKIFLQGAVQSEKFFMTGAECENSHL
jgi:hypothetical protein